MLLCTQVICFGLEDRCLRCSLARAESMFLDHGAGSLPVLPFMFEVVKTVGGGKVWICVSGQGNLRTLIWFLDGRISCLICFSEFFFS